MSKAQVNAVELISNRLNRHIAHVFYAHTSRPNRSKDMVRRFDMRTPYVVHPLWCAMTILQEAQLTEGIRYRGARVLLFHDVLEDTQADLPADLTKIERRQVRAMTFKNLNDEMSKIYRRAPIVRLYKLYDKVSNLLDGTWMSPERRKEVSAYVLTLADDVERNFGNLNIVRMARAIAPSSS